MAKYRPVHCSFWTDPRVLEEFTPKDRFFLLYLLTNKNTTQIGVYCITKKQIAFEMGYSIEAVEDLMHRFENEYKLIKYNTKTRELGIKHWGRYNFIKGGKPIEDCVRKELDEIKDKELLFYVLQYIKNENIRLMVQEHLAEYYPQNNVEAKKANVDGMITDDNTTEDTIEEDIEQISFDELDLNDEEDDSLGDKNCTSSPHGTIRGQKEKEEEKENNNNKNNNNKNNKEYRINKKTNSKPSNTKIKSFISGISLNDENLLCKKIINYLNSQSYQEYNASDPDAIEIIKSKIAEGFIYDDFKRVIDTKCKEWLGTKFDLYLRPSTLFGNKFERYLNQKSPAFISKSIYNQDSFSNRKQRQYDMKKIENILFGYH